MSSKDSLALTLCWHHKFPSRIKDTAQFGFDRVPITNAKVLHQLLFLTCTTFVPVKSFYPHSLPTGIYEFMYSSLGKLCLRNAEAEKFQPIAQLHNVTISTHSLKQGFPTSL